MDAARAESILHFRFGSSPVVSPRDQFTLKQPAKQARWANCERVPLFIRLLGSWLIPPREEADPLWLAGWIDGFRGDVGTVPPIPQRDGRDVSSSRFGGSWFDRASNTDNVCPLCRHPPELRPVGPASGHMVESGLGWMFIVWETRRQPLGCEGSDALPPSINVAVDWQFD